MKNTPPALVIRALILFLKRRVHFSNNINTVIVHEKEDFTAFRKVTLDPVENYIDKPKAILKIYFQFAKFSPKTNRILSIIPIPLIIAQQGFRSKTWLLGNDSGIFQGLYEWDSITNAEKYMDSFVVKLMKRRSILSTLKYEITESENL
jgi:hypothetical protein